MTQPITTTEWAKQNGTEYRWSAALDNYEPTRNYGHGRLWKYGRIDDTRGPGIILDPTGTPLGPNMLVLVDDGATVTPYYVSGWGPTDAPNLIFLSPFPTNVDETGAPILRANDGRPVDFSSWALGPTKCFHLKVREV